MTSGDFVLYRLNASSEAEIKSAVDVLLTAYAEDCAVEALSAGDKAGTALLFRHSLEASLRDGECYLAYSGDVICGVAAWLAPGSDWKFFEDAAFVKSLPQEVQEWYGQHYAPKYAELYHCAGIDGAKIRREGWKLERLGVLPQHRRKGVARALLEVVCGKADREERPMVAEVTNPSQVNCLQRFGFQYRSVKNVSCGHYPGFPIWCLTRDPGSQLIESRRGSDQSQTGTPHRQERSPRRSP